MDRQKDRQRDKQTDRQHITEKERERGANTGTRTGAGTRMIRRRYDMRTEIYRFHAPSRGSLCSAQRIVRILSKKISISFAELSRLRSVNQSQTSAADITLPDIGGGASSQSRWAEDDPLLFGAGHGACARHLVCSVSVLVEGSCMLFLYAALCQGKGKSRAILSVRVLLPLMPIPKIHGEMCDAPVCC